jgi:hypothetical protein
MITVALLFTMQSGTAVAIDLEEVVFARKLSEKMEAIDPGNKFAPDATVYLSAVVKGRPKSGSLKCRFYYREQLISEADIDFSTVNKGLLFSFGESTNVGFHLKHQNPFPISKHFRTELFFNDKKLGSYPFHVVPPANVGPSALRSATLARKVDDDFNPVEETQAFLPTEIVHLAVRADVGLATWLQAEWLVAGEVVDQGTASLTFEENATDTAMHFTFMPEGGWPEGSHEVILTMNDEVVARQKFAINREKPKSPPKTKQPTVRGTSKPRMSSTPKAPAPESEPKTAADFNARGEQHYNAERF